MTTARRAGTTTVATLLGLAVVIGGAHTVDPQWTKKTGLDIWNVPDLVEAEKESQQEWLVLQARAEQLRVEIEITDHLASRLVAGTMSLESAVSVIEPLLSSRSGFLLTASIEYPAPTPRLVVARYLMARIDCVNLKGPATRCEVVARLQREYEDMSR
jgi:hypothetical protein